MSSNYIDRDAFDQLSDTDKAGYKPQWEWQSIYNSSIGWTKARSEKYSQHQHSYESYSKSLYQASQKTVETRLVYIPIHHKKYLTDKEYQALPEHEKDNWEIDINPYSDCKDMFIYHPIHPMPENGIDLMWQVEILENEWVSIGFNVVKYYEDHGYNVRSIPKLHPTPDREPKIIPHSFEKQQAAAASLNKMLLKDSEPEEKNNGWIKVSDVMPPFNTTLFLRGIINWRTKNSVSYFSDVVKNDYEILEYGYSGYLLETNNDYLVVNHANPEEICSEYITHWKPLLEPITT